MENPKQIIFTTEELFSLKPEIADAKVSTDASHSYQDHTVYHELGAAISAESTSSFWKSYSLYIIAGAIVIGGVGFFIYHRNQRKNNRGHEN